jgi:hypothetical protein
VRRLRDWDRTERGEGKYIPVYSKRGVVLLTLAFMGVMYLLNISVWGVSWLIR